MAEIARRNGATGVQVAQTPEEATRLTIARRVAFSALARVAPTTILEESNRRCQSGADAPLQADA